MKRRVAVKAVGAGKIILHEGDAASHTFILQSGWACRFRRLSDGRRQILSFLIPGDVLVLENLCFPQSAAPYSVKSLTDVIICGFAPTAIVELVHGSTTQEQVLSDSVTRELGAHNRRLVDLGTRSALGRVAQLILEMQERLARRRLNQDNRFPFPVRQEHLADTVGLTTVYVNRTLDRLRRYEVIEYDREHMTILNGDRLKAIAEEE